MGLSNHKFTTFFCITTTKWSCERAAKEHIYENGPFYKVEDAFINCSRGERETIIEKVKAELKIIDAKQQALQNKIHHPKSHCYCFTDHLTPTEQFAAYTKYKASADTMLKLLTTINQDINKNQPR